MNLAIILAGGIGSRVGANIPKQFILIDDKPILAYTLEIFENNNNIDLIEIVCHKEWKKYLEQIVHKYGYKKVKWIANGGDTFQESVMNGVFNLNGKISDNDIVSIHFGASPFVSNEIIDDSIRVCKEKGNAISTTNFFLLSTFKDDNDSTKAGKWVDRESIACMNSPHSFKYSLIKEIYTKAIETNAINEVEPHTTTLMQYMGYPIYFSYGTQTNIKITTKEDLELFEGYVLLKKLRRKK